MSLTPSWCPFRIVDSGFGCKTAIYVVGPHVHNLVPPEVPDGRHLE
jgi:hypothetical protein